MIDSETASPDEHRAAIILTSKRLRRVCQLRFCSIKIVAGIRSPNQDWCNNIAIIVLRNPSGRLVPRALRHCRLQFRACNFTMFPGTIEILVCPSAKPLVQKVNGQVWCGVCRRVYPVRDDIPIMLVDEATIDPE